MRFIAAAACAVVALAGSETIAAQVGNPATPRVGSPSTQPAGPPAPVAAVRPEPRTGPLPGTLSLPQALEEAAARSPAIVAAEDMPGPRKRARTSSGDRWSQPAVRRMARNAGFTAGKSDLTFSGCDHQGRQAGRGRNMIDVATAVLS